MQSIHAFILKQKLEKYDKNNNQEYYKRSFLSLGKVSGKKTTTYQTSGRMSKR